MPLWDITAPLSPETPVYPGDEPVRFRRTASIDRGDAANVSAFSMSVHAGTHVDAPSHLGFEGDADAIPLEVLTGECVVVDLSRAPEGVEPEAPFSIRLEDAAGALQRVLESGPVVRLLLKTGGRPATGLDSEFVRALCERGVRLIGLELSSIDPETGPEAETLPAHRAALAAGTARGRPRRALRALGAPDGVGGARRGARSRRVARTARMSARPRPILRPSDFNKPDFQA